MHAHRLLLAFALLPGCYTAYLKQTTDFATTTASAGDSLSALSTLPAELCRRRAQLDYVLERVALPKAAVGTPLDHSHTQLAGYLTSHAIAGTTWQKSCDGYAQVGQSIDKALASLRGYGTALGAVAGGSYDGSDITALANSISSGATTLSGAAAPYKDALSGLGGVLGQLATIIVQAKTAGTVDDVVAKVNPQLKQLAAQFDAIIKILREQQLADVRSTLVDVLDLLEESYLKRDAANPTRDPIQALRMLGFELSWSKQLDGVDGQLTAFQTSIDQLAVAHDQLHSAWSKKGTGAGATELKSVAGLIVDVLQDVDQFRNANKGE